MEFNCRRFGRKLKARSRTRQIQKTRRETLIFDELGIEGDRGPLFLSNDGVYLRSSDQEIDCADIGISAPSAKLI